MSDTRIKFLDGLSSDGKPGDIGQIGSAPLPVVFVRIFVPTSPDTLVSVELYVRTRTGLTWLE